MKKQLLLKICAVSAISILAFSCKKSETPAKSILDNKKTDVALSTLVVDNVYVSGYYLYTSKTLARFWENTTTPTNLTDGIAKYAYAYDIEVTSANDVYVIGTDGVNTTPQTGVYWKNTSTRVVLPLPSGATSAQPRMVFSKGNDVYIAGITWFSGSDQRATYWKCPAGAAPSSSDIHVVGATGSDAFGITVTTAGDVVVAGNATVGGTANTIVYWLNGVQTQPTGGTVLGTRTQIVSIGNDVYIAVGTNSPATMHIFQNGSPITPIVNAATNSISTWSLATDGASLYVEIAGTNNPSASTPTIWVWNTAASSTYQYSITPSGTFLGTGFNQLGVGASGDTYVAGTDGFAACYWKNGVVTNLFGGNNNNVTGIAIK